MAKESKKVRLPNPIEALLPIVVMAGLMIYGLTKGEYVDAHMPLIVAMCVACAIGALCGHSFSDMVAGMLERLYNTLEALLILMTVGLLISSFMMSGTIPALIYYGLNLLTPKLFLPIGCILTAIVGLACGSSWTATATIGIAMLGVGAGLGINPAMTDGMIISGAYVGDKFSPLSDTTNLAAGVSNTGLFDHVNAMVSTTGPTFLLAIVLYTILGLNVDVTNYDPELAQGIQAAMQQVCNINIFLLIPILVIIVVCILKVPGLIGIMISVATGVVFALIFQRDMGYGLSDIFDILHYGPWLEAEAGGAVTEEAAELVNQLLAKGGMDNTMWTINLVILAVAYGGALERAGCVEALFGGLKHRIKTVWQLVLATMITSIFCDAAMGDQFLGVSVPAPLYMDKYDEMGLARNMLSRTLEDAGTLWAVMFPWTGCGAYQMGVLGIHPFVYFPFAFVNLLNPIYAFLTAFFGRNIFWADGAYTNLFGKTVKKAPAACPEDAHEYACKQLEALRAAGKAPKPQA